MPPRVSLIVPTFNRASLVTRAIDSALGQTYANVDIIVVDDGSTDETRTVLVRYADEPRVRVIHLDRNLGVTEAKNAGLANLAIETYLFGILDSDDVLTPGAIETLVGAFEGREDEFSQVFGWCRDSVSGEPTGRMVHREGIVTYDDALSGRFAGEFWQLARRDLLGEARFEPRASGGESSLWWPLLRTRPAWLVPEVVRTYDATSSDRVSMPRYTRAAADGKRWVYVSILRAVGADLRVGHPRQYGQLLSELAKWSALAGDRRLAGAASRQALRIAPSRRALFDWSITWLPAGLLRALIALRSSSTGKRARRLMPRR
jgi:GalNAc5-diNAcBac-PP-undecaprenol beta-1,3-glucosyltransferase